MRRWQEGRSRVHPWEVDGHDLFGICDRQLIDECRNFKVDSGKLEKANLRRRIGGLVEGHADRPKEEWLAHSHGKGGPPWERLYWRLSDCDQIQLSRLLDAA